MLAWHSGLSDDAKKTIRTSIFDGTQRIIIASPESIVTSLARPLFDTARDGRLAYFVVDEAHLVAQWGTEFRPEFQSMCGLRRELLRECPTEEVRFKTLLLSATLSQESADILRELFAEQHFDAVSAVTLRPEPEYWMCRTDFETTRTRRIIELIRVAPRPFLLYVTTREQATAWSDRMRELRIRRSGCVHGATNADIRADVIDNWRAGNLDAVVATSAFGLGMDKSDVRAVIHACVPESVDRYYQEVGRGGRDGKACVSLLIHTDRDREIARGLSSKKVITIEKGLQRWKSMVHHARRDGSDARYLLNLSQKPPGVSGDTEANNKWNLRTVVLLNRARVIRIESLRPPDIEPLPGESDEQVHIRRERALTEYSLTCPVRLLEDLHLSEDLWKERVETGS
jgi:ATP-dependent DNA helicase RecQ